MSTNTNILNALSDPKVFTGFDELLQQQQSRPLDSSSSATTRTMTCSSSTEASKAIANTLRLFSYGTFRDYCSAEPGTFINLNERQLQKLKALTIASVVHRTCKRNLCGIITYETLETELGSTVSSAPMENCHDDNHKSLEDLLIHCIYSNLLPCGTKLDQMNKRVLVKVSPPCIAGDGSVPIHHHDSAAAHVLCRDVDLEQDLPEMIKSLENFHIQGNLIREYLMQNKQSLIQRTNEENEHWKQIDLQLQSVRQRIRNNSKEEGGVFPMESASALSTAMEWAKSSVGATSTSSSALPTRQVKRSRGAGGCPPHE